MDEIIAPERVRRRFGHFERSVVERISQSTVYCFCRKGKLSLGRIPLGSLFFFLLRLVVVDCLEKSLLVAP